MTENGAGVTVRENFVESTLEVFECECECECECEYGLWIWIWIWMWMWMWFLFVLPREGPSPPAQSARPPPWRDGEHDDEPSGPILQYYVPSIS